MKWFEHITSLSNPLDLASYYLTHVFNEQIELLIIDVLVILTVHGFYIVLLTSLFKRFVTNPRFSHYLRTSFVSYLIVIFLVILSHINDIFLLAVVLDSLQVFPDKLTAFYFVSGMYTTIGYSYNLETQWQSLPMIVSFAGLFAFSISGAGLYSMLGYLISPKES